MKLVKGDNDLLNGTLHGKKIAVTSTVMDCISFTVVHSYAVFYRGAKPLVITVKVRKSQQRVVNHRLYCDTVIHHTRIPCPTGKT